MTQIHHEIFRGIFSANAAATEQDVLVCDRATWEELPEINPELAEWPWQAFAFGEIVVAVGPWVEQEHTLVKAEDSLREGKYAEDHWANYRDWVVRQRDRMNRLARDQAAGIEVHRPMVIA